MVKPTSIVMVYLDAVALTLFEKLSVPLVRTFDLNKSIKLAGIHIHPNIYASRVLLLTTFTGFISIIIVCLLVMMLPLTPLTKIVILVLPIIACIMVFAIGLIYPSLMASFRKLYIDSELPFFITYIATMARGGVTVERCLERVSQMKIFKYMSREAGEIIKRVKVFGEDPLLAAERVSYIHPSSKFRDIMFGYVTALRTGSDVVHYLETKAREALVNRSAEIRAMVGRLAGLLEVYIIIGVVASLTMFTLFAVSGAVAIVGGPRLSSLMDLTMPLLYNCVVLPLLGILMLILVHVSSPKTTLPVRVPYYMLLMSMPFAVLAAMSVIVIGGSLHIFEGILKPRDPLVISTSLAVGLLTLSIPPSLAYTLEMRGTKGMIRSLAEFLRDLSEARKTGLSPEKCIIAVSERNYGNLTSIVRRTAAGLAMGITLEKALARSIGRVRDWFLAITFRFLMDSITYGGGSPEVMDSLANFVRALSDSEEELRRSLRAYVMLPYFGALLVASAPLVIIWQLMSSASQAPQPDMLSNLLVMLSTGAIINSYISGLIAGKTSRMVLAAGFTHSLMTTLLTVVMLLVTMYVVGFV